MAELIKNFLEFLEKKENKSIPNLFLYKNSIPGRKIFRSTLDDDYIQIEGDSVIYLKATPSNTLESKVKFHENEVTIDIEKGGKLPDDVIVDFITLRFGKEFEDLEEMLSYIPNKLQALELNIQANFAAKESEGSIKTSQGETFGVDGSWRDKDVKKLFKETVQDKGGAVYSSYMKLDWVHPLDF